MSLDVLTVEMGVTAASHLPDLPEADVRQWVDVEAWPRTGPHVAARGSPGGRRGLAVEEGAVAGVALTRWPSGIQPASPGDPPTFSFGGSIPSHSQHL